MLYHHCFSILLWNMASGRPKKIERDWNLFDPDHPPLGLNNPIPDVFPPPEERIDNMTPFEAMIYLLLLAAHYPRSATPVEMLANTCVACAKQEQITPAFAEKIMRGIQDELGHEVTIDSDTVQILFTHFGRNFDETTAPIAFNRWEEILPENALRFRLTIQQVAFSRLNVYQTILEAIRTFPDFFWPVLNRLLPGDMQRFITAQVLIQENEYYGFREDLGEAASTRYKSLGWVAKELLIQGAGKGTLAQYQGWPRTVPNHDRVRQLVTDYLRRKGDRAEADAADYATAYTMLDAVIENYDRRHQQEIWSRTRGEDQNLGDEAELE
jgi:hypothetical protein